MMRLRAATVVADAGAMFRRDRALLVALAGPFLFLPSFALVLLVPAMPPIAAGQDARAVLGPWLDANLGWYALAWLAGRWGAATIAAAYLAPDRPDAAGAIRRGARALPRVLLADLLIAVPLVVGVRLFVLPALYVLGRTMPIVPVLLAERPVGAWRALERSVRLTHGAGLTLALVAAAVLGTGWLAEHPLLLLDGWLRARHWPNPIAIAMTDAAAAGAAAAAGLASTLLAVAAYRRLAAR